MAVYKTSTCLFECARVHIYQEIHARFLSTFQKAGTCKLYHNATYAIADTTKETNESCAGTIMSTTKTSSCSSSPTLAGAGADGVDVPTVVDNVENVMGNP